MSLENKLNITIHLFFLITNSDILIFHNLIENKASFNDSA